MIMASYIRFTMPEQATAKVDSTFIENLMGKVLGKIIAKANPDFDDKIEMVSEWLVEFDNEGIPNREVGLDETGVAIVKMPWNDNYGYWVDNNLTEQDFYKTFEVVKIEKLDFERLWESFR